eukprot:6142794-Pyramimonas_sp.AAC.1
MFYCLGFRVAHPKQHVMCWGSASEVPSGTPPVPLLGPLGILSGPPWDLLGPSWVPSGTSWEAHNGTHEWQLPKHMFMCCCSA